jgi:hypothetical protein
LLIPRTSYRTSKPHEKLSALKRKRWNFLTVFFWVIFAFLDPDPDPQHWLKYADPEEKKRGKKSVKYDDF